MKLLASDFDGTLTHSGNGKILETDIQAIKAWQDAGNLFGVVTGRDLKGVEVGFEGTGLNLDFIVSLNGAIVFVDDQIVQRLGIDDEKAHEIESMLLEYKDNIFYSTKNNGKHAKKLVYDANSWVAKHFDIRSDYRDEIEDITNFIVATKDEETAIEIEERLLKEFRNDAAPHRSSGNFLDIVAPNIHKADALDIIVKHFNMDPDNVVVIGDSYNDIEMIKAYRGFAIDNALNEIKEIASATVSDFVELIDLVNGGNQ